VAKVEFEDQSSKDCPLSPLVEENVEAMRAHMTSADDIFRQGEFLVRVYQSPETGEIVRITPNLLRVYAARHIHFYVVKKSERIRVSVPIDAARAYLDAPGDTPHKTFGGLTNSPIIDHRSGKVVSKQGYDIRSRLYVDSPAVEIPDKPTKVQAKEALLKLRHAFRTLPYADSERCSDEDGNNSVRLDLDPGDDESSFLIGGVLSAVARASVPLSPLLVLDAPSSSGSGVGKGLATHACSVLSQGRKALPITFGDTQEEFDKRLTATVMSGAPTLMLDNFNARHLGGSTLNSLLTESPSRIRPLGSSNMIDIHHRMWACANGTGIRIREDLARRSVLCTLDSHVEHPEGRKFTFNLLHEIAERRAELLSAAFLILRWGVQNPCPPGDSLGSFEVWSRLVRDPLIALGCRDPAKLRAKIKEQDPEREMWTEILELWWQHHKNAAVCFSRHEKGYTMMHPELRHMLYEALTPKMDPDSLVAKRTLGRILGGKNRMMLNDYRLSVIPRKNSRAQAEYRIEQVAAKS
jgi:hypothetical protein